MAAERLQELIETLKNQGVQKGEDTAAQIIASARREAEEIVARARAEATDIVAGANREAEEVMKRLRSAMEIAASQFVGNLKRVIENGLLTIPMKSAVNAHIAAPEFLKELMTRFVDAYAARPENPDIRLILQAGVDPALKDFALGLMTRHYAGKENRMDLVMESHGIRFGFQVDMLEGNMRLDFTEEAFFALFTEFLAPKFRELFANIRPGGAADK